MKSSVSTSGLLLLGLAFASKTSTAQNELQFIELTGHTKSVNSVAFNLDGTKLASASHDNTVRIWNVETGQLSGILQGHSNWVRSVCWSSDNKTVASASYDRTVRVWNVEQMQEIQGSPLTGHAHYVLSVDWSPDGTKIASGSDGLGDAGRDHTIRIWDVASMQQIGEPLAGHVGYIPSVDWSPNSFLVASGSRDATIRLWNVDRRLQNGIQITGYTGTVHSVSFNPDGTKLASAHGDEENDHILVVWNTATRAPIGDPINGHNAVISQMVWSPDGNRLASSSYAPENSIRIWDATTRQELGSLSGHSDAITSVAWHPNGKQLASASQDRTIRIWSLSRELQSETHTDRPPTPLPTRHPTVPPTRQPTRPPTIYPTRTPSESPALLPDPVSTNAPTTQLSESESPAKTHTEAPENGSLVTPSGQPTIQTLLESHFYPIELTLYGVGKLLSSDMLVFERLTERWCDLYFEDKLAFYGIAQVQNTFHVIDQHVNVLQSGVLTNTLVYEQFVTYIVTGDTARLTDKTFVVDAFAARQDNEQYFRQLASSKSALANVVVTAYSVPRLFPESSDNGSLHLSLIVGVMVGALVLLILGCRIYRWKSTGTDHEVTGRAAGTSQEPRDTLGTQPGIPRPVPDIDDQNPPSRFRLTPPMVHAAQLDSNNPQPGVVALYLKSQVESLSEPHQGQVVDTQGISRSSNTQLTLNQQQDIALQNNPRLAEVLEIISDD